MTPQRGGVLREGYDYDFSRADPATGAHVDPAWCAIYETVVVADPEGQLEPCSPRAGGRIRTGSHGGSGSNPARASSPALCAMPPRSPRRSTSTAIQPSRPSTRSSGRRSRACRRNVGRSSSPSTTRSPGCPRCCAPGTRRSTTRRWREQLGEEWGYGAADGTGPFAFAACVPGAAQEVRRWDDYPGPLTSWFDNRGPAYLDGVRWLPIVDEGERAAALEAGLVDCVQNPSLLEVERLRSNPDLRVIEFQQSSLAYLALDHETTRLGFQDVRVRRAISLAIDRDALVAEDLDGHGWPAFLDRFPRHHAGIRRRSNASAATTRDAPRSCWTPPAFRATATASGSASARSCSRTRRCAARPRTSSSCSRASASRSSCAR